MRLFYFILKYGRESFADTEGEEFPDEVAARQHAVAIAHDLMQSREIKTLSWRIAVCDDYLHPLFDVLFADVDETIPEHLPHDLGASIKRSARMVAAFNDAFNATKATISEVQETLARADKILASLSLGARL